jgi:hypothetical protein
MVNHPNRRMATRHTVTLHIEFDKACNRREAVAMAKDCIYGLFYPSKVRDDGPEEFTVTNVTAGFFLPPKKEDQS